MAFREVTMLEIKEVLRLWRDGRAEEADRARSWGSTSRRSGGTSGAERAEAWTGRGPGRGDGGRGGAARGGPRAAAGRGLGARATSSASSSQTQLGPRRAADEDPQAAQAAGEASTSATRRCAASRSRSSASAAARRRSRWPTAGPARRSSSTPAGSGGSSPTCSAAAGASGRGSSPPCCRATASSTRCFAETTATRDRGVRGGLGVLRRRLPGPHPGQHQGDRVRGRTRWTPGSHTAFLEYAQAAASTSTPRACARPGTRPASSGPCQTVRDDCFGGEDLPRLE